MTPWIVFYTIAALVATGVSIATMKDPENVNYAVEDYVAGRIVITLGSTVIFCTLTAGVFYIPRVMFTAAGIITSICVLVVFYWHLGKRRIRKLRQKQEDKQEQTE